VKPWTGSRGKGKVKKVAVAANRPTEGGLRIAVCSWVIILLAGCGPDPRRRAESVGPEALPVATDTILTPFGEVPEAAWLEGRRWVVVAVDHDAAVVVDFGHRSSTPIGGAGNKELKKPFGVFVVKDTAFIRDWSSGKLTAWADGITLAGSTAGPKETRGILPRARDAAGQYYYEVPPNAGPDGSGNRDSIAVVRSNSGMTRFDTVARLSPVEIQEVQRNSGKRFERIIFSGVDGWGVRPAGALWIARVHQNRVNTIVNAKEKRGEPLPDPVLEVTQTDRRQFIQSFPEDLRNTVEDLPFAPIKPPFERAFDGPDGLVWLRKSRVATDSVRRYHVVDSTGTLSRVLTTIGRGVLIASSHESVLLAEQYSGGVRLMELRIPAPAEPRKP
jgi:hypothetical protein